MIPTAACIILRLVEYEGCVTAKLTWSHPCPPCLEASPRIHGHPLYKYPSEFRGNSFQINVDEESTVPFQVGESSALSSGSKPPFLGETQTVVDTLLLPFRTQ